MHRPQISRAVMDGQDQRFTESSDEIAEMATPELVFTFDTEPQDTRILTQDALAIHVLQDPRSLLLRKDLGHRTEPGADIRA